MNPSISNTTNLAGKVLSLTIIGQSSTYFLQVTVSPTGVATHMTCSNGFMFRLHNLTNEDDIKECVALESNKVQARLPKRGMIPVTTSVLPYSTSVFAGVSE
jgi:hypothetical protein